MDVPLCTANFDELKGELLIHAVKVGFAAFYEELGRVGWWTNTARRDSISVDQLVAYLAGKAPQG